MLMMDKDMFKKVYLLFMHCACVDLFKTDMANHINMSHLTAMYIPVCGTVGTCSLNSEQETLPRVFSKCPDCSCEPDCFFKSNCCYEMFFQSKYVHCRDVTVHSSMSKNKIKSFVVDTCPPHSDKELVEKCEKKRNAVELMRNPPVFNFSNKISYWNQFCASCHGVNSTVGWNLNIECFEKIDFNYLSSHEDILAVADRRNCSIDHIFPLYPACSNPESIVTKCNVSGTWVEFDLDIQKACESDFYLKYEHFKNVFCAMCNPPIFSESVPVKVCNHEQENEFTRACLDQPATALQYPYRNIYCSACVLALAPGPLPYHLIYYTSSYLREKQHYPYEHRMHTMFVSLAILGVIEAERKKLTIKNIPDLDDHINYNVSKLVNISGAAFAEKTCSSNFVHLYEDHDIDDSCSCHVGCATSCCDDVALKHPISCINNAFPPSTVSSGGYYVLKGADITDKTLYSLCNSQNTDDISQLLPVTHYSQGSAASYRNVYCLIAKELISSSVSIEKLDTILMYTQPWVTIISCQQSVALNMLDPIEFFQYTADVNCTKSLYPSDDSIVCKTENADINKCNQTGTWRSFDADILEACEHSEKYRFPILYDNALNVSYKNKFCKICNPHPLSYQEDAFSECASEWPSESSTSVACKRLPNVHVCSRFKNVACEICNGVPGCNISYSLEVTTGRQRSSSMTKIVNTYRSMFAISAFDSKQTSTPGNHDNCSPLETKYQGTCKKLECFPGKYFKTNSCVPLIDNAPNLRYSMNLKMQIKFKQPIAMLVEDILAAVNTWVKTGITSSIGLEPYEIEFENSQLFTTNVCTKMARTVTIRSEFSFFILISLYKRMEKEISLVTFTRSTWNITLNGMEAEIQNYLDTETKLEANVHNENDACSHVVSKDSVTSENQLYKKVLVNDLLICSLVTLTNEEFVLEAPERIRLLTSNRVLSFQQFRITENGSYQACLDDMLHALPPRVEESHALDSISILTGVCTLISILCLFVTFVTYCMFDCLRTVPGVNSMNLIGSLFILQLLVLSRKYYYALIGLRASLFILTHYLLLCVFFWLNTCSFHMWRVFNGSFYKASTLEKRNTLFRYTLYSYCSPLFIILVCIGVSLVRSSGQHFGYGQSETLVDDKVAYILTFISPLSTICLANFVFFLVTAYKIKSTPKVEGVDQRRVHFIVCLKLSTLTGLTWAFQVIDSFLELSFLSYVVEILNGLQGLFLFLSYVCNSRVWSLYRNLWRSFFPMSSPESVKTQSTTSP